MMFISTRLLHTEAVEAVVDDPAQVATITHRWGQFRYGPGAGLKGA